MTRKRPPQVRSLESNAFIDLFAGCGGLSLGLMSAGWNGKLAIEKDKFAFETLSHNLIKGDQEVSYDWPSWFPKSRCRIGIFTKRYKKEILKLRGQVSLIVGGPPCQGYSLAGKRDKTDARNSLFQHYIEVVRLVQPAFLLLENVKGIEVEFDKEKRIKENKGRVGRPPKPFSHRIKESLEKLKYHVYSGQVKAVDFGVPQNRPRYIMFAVHQSVLSIKADLDPFALMDKARIDFLQARGLPTRRSISTKEAISDLEIRGQPLIECIDSPGSKQIVYKNPLTRYQRMLHGNMNGTAPNSLRLANHRKEIRLRFSKILQTCRRGVQLSKEDRKRFGLKKNCTVPLDGDKPSHTLTTLPDDLLHYSEPRILTVREYARLQSFPDWYEFKGAYTTGGERRVRQCPRYTQVGNAVPPLLSELLGIVLQDIRLKLLRSNRK